ncbi:MAG TPA: trypsin-like peptidase domain-containing protein [Candidatus Angelobacter sp.]|jgi:hypothetical protein
MSLEDNLVVILKAGSDTPAGVGVAIGNGLVVTCAHVANLGFADRGMEAKGRPSGELELKFHRLPNTKFKARIDAGVDAWSDPPATRERGADLCLLQLTSPPQEMPAAELWVAEDCEQKQFHAAGFPQDWHGDLDFADGRVMGRDEHGLFMLRSESSATPKSGVFAQPARPAGVIYSGFSGAPVEANGKIVGLIAEARGEIRDITAYMIPVDAFPERIPRHQPWTELQLRSRQQVQRVLPKPPFDQSPEDSLREAYVHRTPESKLSNLVAETCPGMIIIGESGTGKTTMLCHWAREMLGKGHAVLLYRGGNVRSCEVEREICRDLRLPDAPDLVSTLGRIKRPHGLEHSRLIVIFDEINHFRGSHAEGEADPGDLLQSLDAFVQMLENTAIRLVLSCSSAAWKRFDRQNKLRDLTWNCYQGSEPLVLPPFTEEEAQKAYDGNQKILGAKTSWTSLPPHIREHFRRPMLLQLLAQSYLNQTVPNDANTLRLYLKYLDEEHQSQAEKSFIRELATEMLRQQKSSLAIDDQNIPESLRREFEKDGRDSGYESLKEKGILRELEGDESSLDPESRSPHVQFEQDAIAAYVLARMLLWKEPNAAAKDLEELVSHASSFSLGWDAAKVFLRLQRDSSILQRLAGSSDAEQRELAVEALVDLHEDDEEKTFKWLHDLLETGAIERQRTALKAAYYVGPKAGKLFLWACTKGSDDLRQATGYILYLAWRKGSLSAPEGPMAVGYLLWRMDPPFTYKLLHDLVDRINPLSGDLIQFVFLLSIMIYINHCEREDVIEQTVVLYQALARKLQLNLLRTDIFGEAVEQFLFRAALKTSLVAGFARPILRAALQSDDQELDSFLQMPKKERECLHGLASYLDPASDLSRAESDLAQMLKSGVPAFNWAAAVVVGTHAYARFPSVEPVCHRLFEQCDVHGRACMLLAFAVLLPDTPPEWIPLLESFTGQLCKEDEQNLGKLPLLGQVKMLPVPLGLAYAKTGQSMRLFLAFLREASSAGNEPALASCLSGLGAVGFYYPQAVLPVFREFLTLGCERDWELLLAPLSIMRALHTDDIDGFLAEAGQDISYQHRVAANSKMDTLAHYIRIMGLFNNAVHLSARYPKMRQAFSVGAFDLLAKCDSADDFLARYSLAALNLFRAAKFNLREWIS